MVQVAQSPEEAARGDIPAAFFEVIACELTADGRYGAVLSATNEPPIVEHYIDIVKKTKVGWDLISGWGCGLGPGYAYSGTDDGYVVAATDSPPAGIRNGTVVFQGQDHEVPVRDG